METDGKVGDFGEGTQQAHVYISRPFSTECILMDPQTLGCSVVLGFLESRVDGVFKGLKVA